MEAGKLRRPVTIQQQSTGTRTGMGFLPGTWTDVLRTWAAVKVKAITGLATVGASQEPITKDIFILTIRYAPSLAILPGMRVVDGGANYLIQSATDVDERNRTLTLYCSQIPATAAEHQ